MAKYWWDDTEEDEDEVQSGDPFEYDLYMLKVSSIDYKSLTQQFNQLVNNWKQTTDYKIFEKDAMIKERERWISQEKAKQSKLKFMSNFIGNYLERCDKCQTKSDRIKLRMDINRQSDEPEGRINSGNGDEFDKMTLQAIDIILKNSEAMLRKQNEYYNKLIADSINVENRCSNELAKIKNERGSIQPSKEIDKQIENMLSRYYINFSKFAKIWTAIKNSKDDNITKKYSDEQSKQNIKCVDDMRSMAKNCFGNPDIMGEGTIRNILHKVCYGTIKNEFAENKKCDTMDKKEGK